MLCDIIHVRDFALRSYSDVQRTDNNFNKNSTNPKSDHIETLDISSETRPRPKRRPFRSASCKNNDKMN